MCRKKNVGMWLGGRGDDDMGRVRNLVFLQPFCSLFPVKNSPCLLAEAEKFSGIPSDRYSAQNPIASHSESIILDDVHNTSPCQCLQKQLEKLQSVQGWLFSKEKWGVI